MLKKVNLDNLGNDYVDKRDCKENQSDQWNSADSTSNKY